MNKSTGVCMLVALLGWPGLFAQAQTSAAADAATARLQPAAQRVIHCSNQNAGSLALRPCGEDRGQKAIRLGSDSSRQQLDCLLSGLCGAAEQGRIKA